MKKELKAQLDRIEKLLLEGRENILEERKRPLTLEQASRYLHMSKSHLYKLTSTRKIPFYRAPGGKFIYFNLNELEKWAFSRKIKTDEEIKAEIE